MLKRTRSLILVELVKLVGNILVERIVFLVIFHGHLHAVLSWGLRNSCILLRHGGTVQGDEGYGF
jgi:hypothetical protein